MVTGPAADQIPPEVPLTSTTRAWDQLIECAERFASAWKSQSTPPNLAEFLPPGPAALRQLILGELIKLDLEYRFQAGRAKPLADYLTDFPELGTTPPADLIYEEFHLLKQAGREQDAEECLARYPERAAELAPLFPLAKTATMSNRLAGPGGGVPGSQYAAGDQVDDFDLLTPLGQGAFASVFLARQRSLQRLVALKISSDQGFEPQTLAQLDHPQIVRVYDQRQAAEPGLRLLYMQYVPGGTLQSVVEHVRQTETRLRTGRMLLESIDKTMLAQGQVGPGETPWRRELADRPWPEVVCWLGARLAEGLAAAHASGVLHRDVKPANVLLTAEAWPKLADFNVSFHAHLPGQAAAAFFGGSLAYMSPEQLAACQPGSGHDPAGLDGRSDLYSLAVMLCELLQGQRPFGDERLAGDVSTTVAQMRARRERGFSPGELEPPAANWPPGLARVLCRSLAPVPADRFSTGTQLARHLELCLDPQAQALLEPGGTGWSPWIRRHGILSVILAAMIPNLLAGLFNINYNHTEIVSQVPEAEAVFWKIQGVVNSLAFPLGLGLLAWLAWPVVRAIRFGEPGLAPAVWPLARLRHRCLRLGVAAAGISLALWLLAAPAYPLAIRWQIGDVPRSFDLHFAASLALCGLIAMAYPFFGVSWIAVCGLYPALVQPDTWTDEDRRDLQWLSKVSGGFLLAAAFLPLLSVLLLILWGSRSRFELAMLAIWGVVGLASAGLMFRQLQATLATLLRISQPSGIQAHRAANG